MVICSTLHGGKGVCLLLLMTVAVLECFIVLCKRFLWCTGVQIVKRSYSAFFFSFFFSFLGENYDAYELFIIIMLHYYY